MNLLEKILAKLLDSFKAKNPLVYLVIVSGLIGFKFFLDNGDYLGTNEEKVTEWLLFALAVLTGSRTTAVLNKENKE